METTYDRDRQALVERDLIFKSMDCPQGILKEIILDFASLNNNLLKVLLTTYFYDPTVMKAISCIFQSLNSTEEATALNIKNWLTINRVLASGAIGVATVGDLKPTEASKPTSDLFVIKTTIVPDFVGLIHEYFIGLATNQLRKINLGYAYVFGLFACGDIAFDGKNVAEFCNQDSQENPYIVYEKVEGDEWATFLKTASIEAIMTAFLQVIMTLKAGESVGFVHRDLHSENIRNRRLTDRFSFPISVGDIEGYVDSNIIPTLYDYGMSRISLPGGNDPREGNDPRTGSPKRTVFNEKVTGYGVNVINYYPMHDIYKLVMFSLMELSNRRDATAFNAFKGLVSPFRSDYQQLTRNSIADERNTYFAYTANTPPLKYSIDEYVNLIIPLYEDIILKVVHPVPRRKILTCSGVQDDSGAQSGETTLCSLGLVDALARTGIKIDNEVLLPDTLFDIQLQIRLSRWDPHLYSSLIVILGKNSTWFLHQLDVLIKELDINSKELAVLIENIQTMSIETPNQLSEYIKALVVASKKMEEYKANIQLGLEVIQLLEPLIKNRYHLLIEPFAETYKQFDVVTKGLYQDARNRKGSILQSVTPDSVNDILSMINVLPV